MNTRESELAAEVQAQAEELAELRAAISETCTLLGHEGQDADDLRDAVGQLERLVEGKDRDGVPLAGLAAKLREQLAVGGRLHVKLIVALDEAIDNDVEALGASDAKRFSYECEMTHGVFDSDGDCVGAGVSDDEARLDALQRENRDLREVNKDLRNRIRAFRLAVQGFAQV